MSWWRRILGMKPAQSPYGLQPTNPILCGGGVDGEHDYLSRIRCPAGMAVDFERLGSLERTDISYLDRPDVKLRVSPGTRRRLGEVDPMKLPLDVYDLVCECGQHTEEVFIDMYFRGPELTIGVVGWTLSEGVSPAESVDVTAPCPYCGGSLRTRRAKQCHHCKMDWHDPDHPRRLTKRSSGSSG